jgi:preprotein translocase subunit SecF
MQFIKPDVNIDFIGKKNVAFAFSLALIIISIGSLILHGGPRLGIDFQGGTLIQVKFGAPVKIDAIKTGLQSVGLEKSSVQRFGEHQANEYLIRTDSSVMTDEGFSNDIKKALDAETGAQAEIRRVEMVGPQVGQDLREKALFAMFYALLFITIYISGRFEFKWILSGVMAAALIGAVDVF